MRTATTIIGLLLAFVMGVNSGYGLGADQMKCVTYHFLAQGENALVSQELADDACEASNSWSPFNPTRAVRHTTVAIIDGTKP